MERTKKVEATIVDSSEFLYTDYLGELDTARDALDEHLADIEVELASVSATDEDDIFIDSIFSDESDRAFDDLFIDSEFPDDIFGI